jgi:hypothetical protein
VIVRSYPAIVTPNGPALQPRGPGLEMVTHSRHGNAAGHVGCKRELGGGYSAVQLLKRFVTYAAFSLSWCFSA